MKSKQYATCKICSQEMKPGQGCRASTIRCDGKVYGRIKAGDELDFDPDMDEGGICHDCFVGFGQYHHFSCDSEICPICHKQLIGCDCDSEYGEAE